MKKIYKKIKILLSIMIVFFSINISYAENEDKQNEEIQTDESIDVYIDTQLEQLELDEMQKQLEDSIVLDNVDLKSFIKDIISGQKTIVDMFDKEAIKLVLFNEFESSLKVASMIIVLALLSSLLKSLDNSFSSGAISQIINYIIFIVVISVLIVGFKDVLEICNNTLDLTLTLVEIILPIMLGLLALNGLTITSTIMTPIFVGVVAFIDMIFKDFVIMTITVAFAITVINNISKNIKLTKLAKLIKNINLGTIGAMFTIYLLIVSMQMIYIKQVDGFAMTSAKYAIGTFIPVVGGFLSDSINIILSSSQLIKSIFGALGLIILIGVCIIPIIKVISIVFVYKMCAVVVEPIGEESISNLLNEVANLMTVILACIIAITFMFFVTIAVLTSISAIA